MEDASYAPSTGFLDLPQELQNHVYSYYFRDVKPIVNCVCIQKSTARRGGVFLASISGFDLPIYYVCSRMRKDSQAIRRSHAGITLRVRMSETLRNYAPREWHCMILAVRKIPQYRRLREEFIALEVHGFHQQPKPSKSSLSSLHSWKLLFEEFPGIRHINIDLSATFYKTWRQRLHDQLAEGMRRGWIRDEVLAEYRRWNNSEHLCRTLDGIIGPGYSIAGSIRQRYVCEHIESYDVGLVLHVNFAIEQGNVILKSEKHNAHRAMTACETCKKKPRSERVLRSAKRSKTTGEIA